jgi:hypothetical protein
MNMVIIRTHNALNKQQDHQITWSEDAGYS